MSLIHIEGFDGLATANGESISTRLLAAGWVDVSGAIASTDTRIGRGYSMGLDATSTGGGERHAYLGLKKNLTTIIMGFAFEFFSGFGPICRVRYDNMAGTSYDQFTLFKNGVGGISVLDSSLQLIAASDNAILYGSGWNFIEFMATGTTIEVKLNGETVIDVTGAVLKHPSAPALYNQVGFTTSYFSDHWNQGTAPRWDDLYIGDAEGGGVFAGYLRDVVIEELRPTADVSTFNQMDAVGVTDHYDAVDDTGTDEDGTYLLSDAADEIERFEYGDLPAEVIDVLAVRVSTRARKEGTGYKCFQNQITVSSTSEEGAVKYTSVGYTEFADIFTEKPGGGSWTVSDVNAMQVGLVSVETP